MLFDIEQAALAKGVEGLKLTNAAGDGVLADVPPKFELQAAADAEITRLSKIHIVVNNAGITGGGGYGFWADACLNWTIGVNLTEVIWGVEIFGPLMEGHGEGVQFDNTGSIAGMIASNGNPYNVTKYAVVALSEGLRNELGPRGIEVSVLCPGVIRTQIIDSTRIFPDRFSGVTDASAAAGPAPEPLKMIRGRIAGGIDPIYVGELVREGVENDWPYIVTDNEFEPFIEARLARIKEGLDQVCGRETRR